MFGIKKLLFGEGASENLPADVRDAVNAWLVSEAEVLESSHFLTRYVVVDVATTGLDPERDRLIGIAATVLHKGVIAPAQSLCIDLAAADEPAMLDRQLAAFLHFVGKSPLVAYHAAYVASFLQPLIRKRLGVNFQPRWVDLVWLLPAMFGERSAKPLPLDDWLVAFGLDAGEGRRTPVANSMLLARLMQMLVVRAHRKGIDTVEALIDESKASSHLRRTH
ncbi:hypothetical protein [Azonexus sp.]|uniref:hypothetical protein n=1 Tax=Azonexus sp. TaxID=1872668 RepID=UPI0035AF8FA9